MKATVGRIWEAASSDATRPVLTCVMFDAEKATLAATNSYLLAVVPCEVEEGDESGLIPAAALKAAAGRSLAVKDGVATLQLDNGTRTWNLGNGTFPDVDKLLPDAKRIESPIGINPDLAAHVGAALGAGGKAGAPLTMHPVHPMRPMLVEGPHGGIGVLMPVRLTSKALPLAVDLSDDAIVVAACRAAVALLEKKRGKKKAAQAFRDTLRIASVPAEKRP